MQNAPGANGCCAEAFRVLNARDERLLAQHVQASVERAFDQRRMTARRGADVDEIELFAGQEIIDRLMPPAIGTGGEEGLATRRGGVGRSHDALRPHGLANPASGRWPRHCRSR